MYSLSIPTVSRGVEAETPGAGQRCLEVLLNCYCREVAALDGDLSVGPLFGQNDWPMSLRALLQRSQGQALHVVLPGSGARLLTVVAGNSIHGTFRYLGPIYQKSPGRPWCLLDWRALAGLLLGELASRHDVPLNAELLEQIQNSVAVTTRLLSAPAMLEVADDPARCYVESEQSLVFGHPFHPAPKSRTGFSDQDLVRYSPETRSSFPLHYFAVRRDNLVQRSLLDRSCDELIADGAPEVESGHVAVPVHPWQAGYLRSLQTVKQAMDDGRLHYLGEHGAPFYPTSSIRTLYQPGNPWFYKFSLNIRVTNCVRKNAWYELESALQVTRLLQPLLPGLYREFDGLRVLEEPAFLSVDLELADADVNRSVVEGFGMIVRRSVESALDQTRPMLAGSLFGDHVNGEARLFHLLGQQARLEAAPLGATIERWFSEYVQRLVYPVLHFYFAHGVIFEPHLQNVVIGAGLGRAAWPRQIFLRDFEGVKLLRERFDLDALGAVSERARESLWYDSESGWNRIAYCLFVNNLWEAIGQLCARDSVKPEALWSIVRHHLGGYQARYGDIHSERRIRELLSGRPLPGKANLTNRFLKRPDRAVTYVPVPNPLARCGAGDAWS